MRGRFNRKRLTPLWSNRTGHGFHFRSHLSLFSSISSNRNHVWFLLSISVMLSIDWLRIPISIATTARPGEGIWARICRISPSLRLQRLAPSSCSVFFFTSDVPESQRRLPTMNEMRSTPSGRHRHNETTKGRLGRAGGKKSNHPIRRWDDDGTIQWITQSGEKKYAAISSTLDLFVTRALQLYQKKEEEDIGQPLGGATLSNTPFCNLLGPLITLCICRTRQLPNQRGFPPRHLNFDWIALDTYCVLLAFHAFQ